MKELCVAEVSSLAGGGIEIMDGAGVIHTTINRHLLHCLYTWGRLTRVASAVTLMGPTYSNKGHVKYCFYKI